MPISLQDALLRTIEHREIFPDEMLSIMRRIMSGEVTPVMIAALTVGLRYYVDKNGFPSVVLGLSGGIDSALVAALALDALGGDRVIGVVSIGDLVRAVIEEQERTIADLETYIHG